MGPVRNQRVTVLTNNVCVDCCRFTRQAKISPQMNGLTGDVMHISRMIADVITMHLTSAGVETGWSFSTCDVL